MKQLCLLCLLYYRCPISFLPVYPPGQHTIPLSMHTWISDLPEASTCFIVSPLDYSKISKADFPSKEINMILDNGSHKMLKNYILMIYSLLINRHNILAHCTSVSGLYI